MGQHDFTDVLSISSVSPLGPMLLLPVHNVVYHLIVVVFIFFDEGFDHRDIILVDLFCVDFEL